MTNKCDTVYFIWSLKRSGAHGVEEWLFPHLTNHVFFNNVKPQSLFSGAPQKYKDKKDDDSTTWSDFVFGFEDVPFFFDGKMENCEDILKSAGLYEKYGKIVNIIVLRDIVNLIASRLKIIRDGGPPPMSADRETLNLWMLYAKEFMGITNHLTNKVCINYNKWFIDEIYRRQISEQMGLKFTDKGKETFGARKSSFDSMKTIGSISELKVLERWRHFEDDDEYIKVLSNPEALAISEEIFGDIPVELALKLRF